MILNPESSNTSNSLSGKWSTNMLATAFDWEQKPPLVNGNDLRVYMFLPDGLMYNVNHILQYGNKTQEYNYGPMPYVFTMPDHLMLGSEEFKISFKNKQMYLDSKDEYYVKIN